MLEKICQDCGRIIEEGSWSCEYRGEPLCEDCYSDNYYTCEKCGEIISAENVHYIDDTTLCDDCFEYDYRACACCGDFIHRHNTYSSADGDICEYCNNEYYVECYQCGSVIHMDNATYDDYQEEWYCDECYENRDSQYIHDYYYKPEPEFYGKDSSLYMGIELEIDGAGENGENAKKLLNIEDRIYCKHDGSLENGFEIVSQPCTYDFHADFMSWQELLEKALEMGYTSHNAGTCGLHIHISRAGLGDTLEKQEETLAKILYFVEKHWSNMLIFSRRTEAQLNQWASRYGIEDTDEPASLLDKAKKSYARYKAINLLNAHTVEFRLFRGTLKHNTFMATLQLVYSICNYCKHTPESQLITASWQDFALNTGFPELEQYLKERKLITEERI